jgi:hypothetical protein
MGLLKDAIGSAIGAGQPNNGLGGPSVPWKNRGPTPRYNGSTYPQQPGYDSQTYNDQPYGYRNYGKQQPDYNAQSYDRRPVGYRSYDDQADNHPQYNDDWIDQEPPPYNEYPSEPRSTFPSPSQQPQQRGSFQPLGLPQISHGDGQPFLRGYGSQLAQYGISDRDFMRVVDAINVAVIPNPENQIFQKGANIAGWFVPGAASIGLMAGQAAVGLGSAYGHASNLSKTLSKANLELFLPQGLEICIMSTQNIDDMFGIRSSRAMSRQMPADAMPEHRLSSYRNLLAPLSMVLAPLAQSGRNDPIAMIGRRFGDKKAQDSIKKARESAAKGEYKDQADVKWVS